MPQRVFTPLNGDEVKKMVLKEIEKDMDLDSDFRQHITYPTIEWEWSLKIVCTQRTPPEFEKKVAGTALTVHRETNKPVPPPPDAKPISKIIGKRRAVTVPDKDRASANMPILTPRNVEGVGVVDIPRMSEPARNTRGRGVIIKNRAAEGFTLDE